jgi:hypothetical protein
LSEECQQAAKQLVLLMDVINQTVGDALSDLLLVESVLHANGWSIAEWDAAYTDLPNRQLKVQSHNSEIPYLGSISTLNVSNVTGQRCRS